MIEFVKNVFGRKEAEAPAPGGSGAAATAAPAAEPVHVTDETFAEVVLGAPLPVLVDFWAPWCGPCRMVAPVVQALAEEYEGRALMAKINTDQDQQVAARLGIMGIPTIILFKDGQEVDRVVGFLPRKALEARLRAVVDA